MSGAAGPRVAILGGGTAGWMAACLMARAWPGAAITLVEAPEIGIVGVGEGSTPHLRTLFAGLGLAEADWMPRANATYKTGIAFRGWGAPAAYFHPFPSAIDLHTEPAFHAACAARRAGIDVAAHPDRYFLNSWLAEHRRAPIAAETFPFEIGYGYHFDAHLVGAVLRGAALSRGVRHVEARVGDVERTGEGDVAALVLTDGRRVEADIFVDASGFRATIATALGVPFRSFADVLFNDRAVVIPTPHDAAPEPFTAATTLGSGWVWRIPLTTRVGNGYVYSGAYTTSDAAERELRTHLGIGDDVTARHVDFRVGVLETSWTRNCLAIGLAQGFLEPLEATALHLTQATIEGFVQAYSDGAFSSRHRTVFNATITRRWEGIRDYIVCHYRMARRADTPYWRDAAAVEPPSDALRAVMTAWFTGGDLVRTVIERGIDRYYAPMSWAALFAGYGQFPARLRAPNDAERIDPPSTFLDRCGINFSDHQATLEHMGARQESA